MTLFPVDSLVFTGSDLKRLFLRHRSKIKRAAIAGGIATFVFLLFQEPIYRQEATFKQSLKQGDLSLNMKEMFQQYMTIPSENAVIAVMQSKGVLRDVSSELGMQAECNLDMWIKEGAQRIWENLCSEFGSSLSDRDRFLFSHVIYSGENPLKMFLKVTDAGAYQLFDHKKQLLGQAALGEQILVPQASLVLNRIPKDVRADCFYSLVIQPWETVVRRLRKRLKIVPLKCDKNILKIEFNH